MVTPAIADNMPAGKERGIVLLVAAILLAVSTPCYALSGQQRVDVTLTIGKQVYQLGESVVLDFRMTNKSADYVFVPTRIMVRNYLKLRIIDEESHEVPYSGILFKLAEVTEQDFLGLLPSHYYGKLIDIVKGQEKFNDLRAGKYRIEVTFENRDMESLRSQLQGNLFRGRYPPENVWSGSVVLPAVRFEVVK